MLVAAAVAVVALGACAASASATLVTITLSGSQPGRVVSPPGVLAGIDCSNIPGQESTDCSFELNVTRGLPLTATGGPGASLLEWTTVAGNGGTCRGGLNPCETPTLNAFMPIVIDARFGPTPEPPSAITGGVSDVQFPSARVAGEVNPNSNAFSLTECRFEYGTTASYGKWAPCRPNVTTGVNMTPVSTTLGVLEPNTTYHYRLKAATAGGTVVGDDASFTTGPAPADNCPNALVRAQQGALGMALPDCMAYELVAPAFTAGGKNYAQLDEGEDLVALYSLAGYGGVLNVGALGVYYKTERTATGWETTAIAPPAKDFPSAKEQIDRSSDQRRYLSYENLKADEGTNRRTPIVREEDGTFAVAGPTFGFVSGLAVTGIVGTSANLDTVVTLNNYRPAQLTDGTIDTRASNRGSLLASTRDADGNLEIRQVAYRAGATMSPSCSVALGGTTSARAAVSADGSKIFFTIDGTLSSCKTPAIQRVWAKVGAADPIDLSESRCTDGNCGAAAITVFAGASRDGSRVYFTTQQKLVNGDQDTSNKTDLYEYDFNASGEKLRPVTASSDPAGAGIIGNGVTRISDDGSRVYFVANGRPLAGANARGVAPQAGGQNLYVYHREAGEAEGTTTFVAALDPGEMTASARPAKASSGSGRFLLFASTANLTGEKQSGDTFRDLYRYDSHSDELRRIWSNDPAHNGSSRTAGPGEIGFPEGMASHTGGGFQKNWHGGARQISDDGATIAFSTREPLSPWDANQQQDVYLWRANTGRLTMLTDGYADAPKGFNTDFVTNLSGMSRSGNSIFLTSYRPLLAAASSGQVTAFVVRVNGGFPDAPKPPVCVGDGCQGPGTVSPGSPEIGTGKESGSGNVPTVARGELSVVRPKAVRGTRVVMRVKAPGKGRLRLSGRAVRRSSKRVARAGSYRIAVRLTPRAAQRLRKSGRLGVRVRVAFRPATGRSSSQAVSVTFKTQKAGKKGGR
jgi:hypothetical protein